MGADLQSQNHIVVYYIKTFGPGAWLKEALWKINISLTLSQKEKSLAPKLTNHEKSSKRVQHLWLADFQFDSKIKSTYPYLLPATLTKALWQKQRNPEQLCLFRPQYRDLDPLDIKHYHSKGLSSKNMS